MIPRPQSDSQARFNPGRWVCNIRPERCNGIFRVYGQDMKCPLRAKCLAGTRNSYEWTFGEKFGGAFVDAGPGFSDPFWQKEHRNRFYNLLCAYKADYVKEKKRAYKVRHREEINRKDRELRARRREEPAAKERKVILPCGEDCENCPYDICPYSDKDEDLSVEAERKKKEAERCRAYRAGHKEQIYARQKKWVAENRERDRERKRAWVNANREKVRKYERAYQKAWREANKEKVKEYGKRRRQRARSGGDAASRPEDNIKNFKEEHNHE